LLGIFKVPSRLLQFLNASPPIDVTVSGIIKSPLRPLHPSKELIGILLIVLPKFILVNPEHKPKHATPRLVTELGKDNAPVNPPQLLKALKPIVVKLLPSVKLPLNPVHISKALSPIEVTLFPIVKEPLKIALLEFVEASAKKAPVEIFVTKYSKSPSVTTSGITKLLAANTLPAVLLIE
jgi:hypothetical protein